MGNNINPQSNVLCVSIKVLTSTSNAVLSRVTNEGLEFLEGFLWPEWIKQCDNWQLKPVLYHNKRATI